MGLKYAINDLFPQPLVKMEIDVKPYLEYFWKHMFKNTPDEHIQNWPSSRGIKNYYNDSNVFDYHDQLKPLQDDLIKKANWVYQNVHHVDNTLRITNAWFNLAQPGAVQNFHNHCNSMLSGTLYLTADEYTQLIFGSPYASAPTTHNQLRDQPMDKENEKGFTYHYDETQVVPKSGEVLFWNSFLMHGYPPNNTKDRLSLSFNMMPEQVNRTYKI